MPGAKDPMGDGRKEARGSAPAPQGLVCLAKEFGLYPECKGGCV